MTGSLGLIVSAPLAILVGRYMRRSTWFPIHAVINVLVAILVISCFGMGVWATGSPAFVDTHHKVGLAIFIIVIIQVLLGAVAHKSRLSMPSPTTRVPTLASKSPIRLVHIVFGLATIALSFYQVHSGFEEWETSSDEQTAVPNAVKIVFWILLGVFAAAYLIGWLLEILGRLNRPRAGSLDGQEMSQLQQREPKRGGRV